MLVVRRVHFTMRHSSCNTAVLTRNLEALQPDAMPHCRTKSAPAPPILQTVTRSLQNRHWHTAERERTTLTRLLRQPKRAAQASSGAPLATTAGGEVG